MKSMSGTPTIGLQKMVVVVALSQYLQEPLQSSLKYCQVVAQVAHQVVTTITAENKSVASSNRPLIVLTFLILIGTLLGGPRPDPALP